MTENYYETLGYGTSKYHVEMENVGNIVATTLYKDGKIVLYEETTKEVKHLADYGDFEVTKVLKRIHFDENGQIRR